jgi:XRE family transcriptional regulator, regulator of sulfur utilization
VGQRLNVGFGNAIKALRAERGISQEELGRLAGLHRAHVGEIERGEISPTLDSVQVIAEALGERPSNLLALAEEQPPTA